MQDNAAAPANPGEAAPLNNVDTPAAPAAPASTPEAPALTAEQVAQFLGTTPETLKSYQDFVGNNGGWDKSLNAYKKAISGRQADPAPQAQIQTPSSLNDSITQQQPVTAQPPAPKPIEGGITPEEFMTQQYFNSLASQEQYKNIAEQMRSGEVLKEMAKFDIQPMINGQFNDQKVRNFLDLYSKSVPAPTPSTPVTNTPTVEYVQVGESITNMNEAMAVLKQDQELRAQGLQGHPMAKQANEFFDGALNAHQKRGQVQHKALDK